MKLKNTLLALPLLTIPVLSQAAMLDIKITNLTNGITFTPLLVTAHTDANYLFRVGMDASTELQAMAEGGSLAGLETVANSISAVSVKDPAGGMLAPTASAMVSGMDTGSQTHLTIVGMLLPTNDGFVGLDSWKIPTTAGTYHVYLNGYDAGTEANNELIANGSGASGVLGIPASPDGNGGTGGSGMSDPETNTKVHIHPGNVGDSNPTGGSSDVDSRIHRWLNPVAKVTVTVK